MKKHSQVKKIHPHAQKTIDHYLNLRLGGKHVTTPYFMNRVGRKGRRSKVGKGNPIDLEKETIAAAKKQGFDLSSAQVNEIKDFMIDNDLGVDCSGLITWMLQSIANQEYGKPVWADINFHTSPLRSVVVKRLRPVENISVKVLTSPANSRVIHDLREVRPGDLIRSLNGNHVLAITEIGANEKDHPVYFKYVNSTENNGVKYGVRYGLINIKDHTKPILHQEWIDGENGKNWIYEGAANYPKDTKIVRPKLFSR